MALRYNDQRRADGKEPQKLYRFTYDRRIRGDKRKLNVNVLAKDHVEAIKTYAEFFKGEENLLELTEEEMDHAMSSLSITECLEGILLVAD